MTKFINRLKRMFIVGFRQIQDPYYHGFAAQISFYLMLSVVPVFLLLIQVLGLFNISVETAIEVVEEYTGHRMSGIISTLFEFNYLGFGNIIFLIIALWAGSRASFAISRITNYTMTEGKNTGKNYFIERVRAMFTMFLTMLSLVLALVILCNGKLIILGILSVLKVENTSAVDSLWMHLRWPLGFILYFFIIGYNYYISPTVRQPFRTVIPGAAFASLGIVIVSLAYSFYTNTLSNYDILYGALSSVVAVMIWFLLLSWVIILGVMCNKVFNDTARPFSKSRPPEYLERSREIKERQKEETIRQSRFDMDPDDVNIRTIKSILMGADPEKKESSQEKKENGSEERPDGENR